MEGPIKIYVVDDDKNTCDALKDEFEDKGFDVLTANSGGEAIDKIKSGYSPHVILMDIKMPVMNGVEAFKEIKAINPNIVVIMMTAYADEDIMKSALQEGAYTCLHKPFNMEKITEWIRQKNRDGIFVLIVDDDRQILESLKDELADQFHVSIAETPDAAFELAKQRPHDILVVDMMMPTLNGLETYLKIKKISPKTTAIIITGHREEAKNLVNLSLDNSAYTCLYKPFDPDHLAKVIKEIMGKKKTNKRLKAG